MYMYMYAAPFTLKSMDKVYHSSLRFDSFRTRCCKLYQNVGRSSLIDRREKHCLRFVYMVVLQCSFLFLNFVFICLFNFLSFYCFVSPMFSLLPDMSTSHWFLLESLYHYSCGFILC